MKITEIYQSWGTILETTYDEVMSLDSQYLTDLVLSRNLLVVRNLTTDLTDEEYFRFGEKFGRVWTTDIYKKPFINTGHDRTLNDQNSLTPVSYFQSHNTMFGHNYMHYHADMPHVNEYSFPGRCLYLTKNTMSVSGTTTWLNLELGWMLCSDSERRQFDNISVVYHDMYVPGQRLEKRDFLKTNPKTGKLSPSVNCWYYGKKPNGVETKGWIHHLELDGQALNVAETGKIISDLYALIESKPNTIYSHPWQEGDCIVYDNWFNVHKRDPVIDDTNHVRLLKRLTFNFY